MPPAGFKRSRALWDEARRPRDRKVEEWKSLLRAILYELQPVRFITHAGPVVLISTALAIIFTVGLGDNENDGELSAYSVFNRGFQRLMGSVDVEELVNQHVGGGMMMGAAGMHPPPPLVVDDDQEHRRQERPQQPRQNHDNANTTSKMTTIIMSSSSHNRKIIEKRRAKKKDDETWKNERIVVGNGKLLEPWVWMALVAKQESHGHATIDRRPSAAAAAQNGNDDNKIMPTSHSNLLEVAYPTRWMTIRHQLNKLESAAQP
ncbi:expressed unknown protein [Seminavis robusta]|uniref:SAYSvFN domain-containing protein n=1 Tax=Seminavis robusta TaxID=568900 RepID=A0A9N8HNC7_9STRA|nr:expressed unknown protein [Seminavis robusta]|eukprot:Sro810_g205750.1 n/a (262) ;mRNA; f:23032-24135